MNSRTFLMIESWTFYFCFFWLSRIKSNHELKFQKWMKRKRLGQSQTWKVVRARKLWKRCPNLTNSWCYYYSEKKKKNTHGAIRLFTFVSFFYVKCKEETNMLYCVCDLYEFERLAKNSRIPTFFFLFLF